MKGPLHGKFHHLAVLKEGVNAWNKWREESPNTVPDLSRANLEGVKLLGINLQFVNLMHANLVRANLFKADFRNADLIYVDLRHADLTLANFNRANLRGAHLEQALFWQTKITSTSLYGVRGLTNCRHRDRQGENQDKSQINQWTFAKSSHLPQRFRHGLGLSDAEIDYYRRLSSGLYRRHSCVISHSSQDDTFARKLCEDLQDESVLCWFAPDDLKIGEPILSGIDRSIREHDKLLLVLSENSIESSWVEQEVQMALAKG